MAIQLNSLVPFTGSLRTIDGQSVDCNTIGGSKILEVNAEFSGTLLTSNGSELPCSTYTTGFGNLFYTGAPVNAVVVDLSGRQVQIVAGSAS